VRWSTASAWRFSAAPPAVPLPAPHRSLKSGKAHTGARARFARTSPRGAASLGELTRGRAGKAHLNLCKSGRRLTRLGSVRGVSAADLKRVRRLMPFS
jgi:ribosomal protein L35